MLEDSQIIWKLRRADKEALRQVYLKYKDSMYTTAAALLNDFAAAEGVLHDVFVSFAEDAPALGLYRSINTYLAECVINCSNEILRGKMYKVVDVLGTRGKSQEKAGSADETSAQENIADVMAAMMQVPLPQRQAVALHLFAGLSFREIAQLQQVSITTAQARYSYGMEKLAGILDRQVET